MGEAVATGGGVATGRAGRKDREALEAANSPQTPMMASRALVKVSAPRLAVVALPQQMVQAPRLAVVALSQQMDMDWTVLPAGFFHQALPQLTDADRTVLSAGSFHLSPFRSIPSVPTSRVDVIRMTLRSATSINRLTMRIRSSGPV